MKKQKEKEQTIAQLNQSISGNILEAIYFLEIISDIVEGEGKFELLIKYIKRNLQTAFNNIEKCRQKICIH